MRLLAFDTATRDTAVAVLDTQSILAEVCEPAANHSRSLLPEIDRLLRSSGLTPRDLEAIAVGIGPGSFTGVRIGLTVAKTLAYARQVPLVGISSLRALAEGGRGLGDRICPALDALKGEVFCASYAQRDGSLEEVEPAAARDPLAWARQLVRGSGTRVVLGSALSRYRQVLVDSLGDRLVIPAPEQLHRISAGWLGRLGAGRLGAGEADDPATLEPLYCRLSEAELAQQRKARSTPNG